MKLDTSLTLPEFIKKLDADKYLTPQEKWNKTLTFTYKIEQRLTKELVVNLFKGFKVQDSEEWIRFYNGVRVYYPSTENTNAYSYVFREGIKPPTLAEVFNNAKFELQNFEI